MKKLTGRLMCLIGWHDWDYTTRGYVDYYWCNRRKKFHRP